YPEIASFLNKSEVSCRQWFSRAKKHLTEHRPRFHTSPEVHQQLLTKFLEAAQAGEMTGLMELLSEDIVLWADGGGKIKGAATHPITGRVAVAQFTLGVSKLHARPGNHCEITKVNSQPALVFFSGEQVIFVLTIEVEGNTIRSIRGIANP